MQPDNNNTTTKLRIWQQNLNKSLAAQQDLINNLRPENYEIVLIQEPYIDHNRKTRASSHWRVVYPSTYYTNLSGFRSVILINAKLNTNSWKQIEVKSSDITAIQLTGTFGQVSIFNIYNDCKHSRNIRVLEQFLFANIQQIQPNENSHMIWAGDFNRHHPYWDEPRNRHLFTSRALQESQILIDLLADYNMHMALPPHLPTLHAHRTKNWTRVDNFFCTGGLEE